ncbi:hypothetical protein LZ31DRAFT_559242 [Colletotrichum somersetense]|nr:hypothetical protein LZ31DRAFT_559242 [Colletotrichum somersetense]
MAFESPALMYALAASSSAHLALQDDDFRVAALQHSGLALAELKASMSRGTLTREMRLAATLVLCSMESISCGTDNWVHHLSGAAACLEEDNGHEGRRHAALIHLYRVLRRHVPYHSGPLRQKTRKSVDAICAASDSIPKGCYAETSMIFPLFMAGGEAETAQHVEVIRGGLCSLNSRRRFRNADACVDVLDEVWRLAAAGVRKRDSAKVDWLDVTRSRNWKLALS